MSTTVFKGGIGKGTISAKFLSDFSNADSDLLMISYGETGGGGGTAVDQGSAAPGGFANVSVSAPKQGVLEVWVVTGNATDSGRLSVFQGGSLKHDEAILGSVRWVYSVG